jgi:hypothetical protein
MTRSGATACFLIAALSGCASSHNSATDGSNVLGGGYSVSKLRDGIYYISSSTNWAPWVNMSGATRSWRDRARENCGSDKYAELEISESSHDHLPPIGMVRYIVTTRTGYAVCESANLSNEAATAAIRKR